MKETPAQRARRLMGEVSEVSRENYSKGEVKSILNSIAGLDRDDPAYDEDADDAPESLIQGCRDPAYNVPEIRRGDVFIAKGLGGKERPWVLLRRDDRVALALPLTSSSHDMPGSEPARSRFWRGSSIGLTICLFRPEEPIRVVSRPYTDLDHLGDMENRAIRLVATGKLGEVKQ